MHATWILAAALGLFFAALGTSKMLALPAMRERAQHLDFSVGAYRAIGLLELAGAIGLALGLIVPVLGALAAVGLLLLLAAALVTHVRNHDAVGEASPAIVAALLVAVYLIALAGVP